MKQFHPINVGPLATNVLDLVGRADLVTETGKKVVIRRTNMDRTFVIIIDNQVVYSGDENVTASYWLNYYVTGRIS